MLRWECIHESKSRQGDVRQIRVTMGVHSGVKITPGRRSADPCYDGSAFTSQNHARETFGRSVLRWECILESKSRQGDVRQTRVMTGVHSRVKITSGRRSADPCYDGSAFWSQNHVRETFGKSVLRWECIHNTSQNHAKETRRSADSFYDDGSDDLCYDGSAFTTH